MKQKIGNYINLALFFGVFGFFTIGSAVKYFTSDWGDEAVAVKATITDIHEITRYKKGRLISSYKLSFEYPKGNSTENGVLNFSGDSFEELVSNNSFDLVYKKDADATYVSKSTYDKKPTIGRVLIGSLMGLVLGLVVMVFVGGFLNKLFKFFPEEERK